MTRRILLVLALFPALTIEAGPVRQSTSRDRALSDLGETVRTYAAALYVFEGVLRRVRATTD